MIKRSLPVTVLGLVVSIFVALSIFGTLAEAQTKAKRKDRSVKDTGPIATPLDALPTSAKRYALIVGVDKYDDAQIPKLEGASNDAKALEKTLVKYAGFPKDQVFLLTTDQPGALQPTKANILRKFSNLLVAMPKDGLLLISFSGHGIERNERAFLLPADAEIGGSNDLFLLEQTAILAETLTSEIKKFQVKQVMVILDACRKNPAGGRNTGGQPMSEAYTRGFNFSTRNNDISAFVVLYATKIGDLAYEDKEKKQGYLSLVLIEGLTGAAANEKGEVTLTRLVTYVQETVPKLVSLALGREQRPFVSIDGYKADELVLSVVEKPVVVAAKPVTVEPAGYHALSFEAAEKANKGDFDGAISDYEYAIKLDALHADEYKKKIADIYGNRGYSKFNQADYEGATRDFTEAIKFAPSALLYNASGSMKGTLRDYKGAIEDFTKAIELDPNFANAYANRGKMYEAKGEHDKAQKDFDVARQFKSEIFTDEKGLEKNSELMSKVKSLITSGNQKANRGDYDGAIADYTRAINLNPKYSTPYYLRGNAKFNKEYFIGFTVDYKLAANNKTQCRCLDKVDYELLSMQLTKAIAQDPKNPMLYQNRGLLYAARDEVSRAVEDFKKAIEIDPKFYIAYMAWGIVLIPRDTSGAVKRITKAIEINPRSGAAYYLRYQARFQSRKEAAAEVQKDLDLAVKNSPEDVSLLFRRTGVLEQFEYLPWVR